jgi:hypothetical protein
VDIRYHNGCVFFGETKYRGHISYEKVKFEFQKVMHKMKLDLSYHIDKAGNRRYKYVTHCFRSTAGEKIFDLRKDPFEVMVFFDHNSLLSTMPYIYQFKRNHFQEQYLKSIGGIVEDLCLPIMCFGENSKKDESK